MATGSPNSETPGPQGVPSRAGESPPAQDVRKRVIYSGRVQGVGFRATTQRIAQRFDVRGFVRNLTDGTVELVAEASPHEVDRFLAAVAAAMQHRIARADVSQIELREPLRGFGIR